MTNRIRTILIILLSSITVISAAKRPAWVDSTPTAPQLYQGIGVADQTGTTAEDRLRADQNARTEIIQEISSNISSEVSAYYQETAASGNFTADQNFEVFTSLSSAYAEATIEGIKIVDRYFDKKNKTHYSYATLSRAEFRAQMTRKANEARAIATASYAYAQEALGADNISMAISHLSTALSHVLVAQSIIKKQLEGDLQKDGSSEFLVAGLSNEISKLIHKMRFIKGDGDGQKAERDQALFGALTGRLIYEDDGREIPASNTALAVTMEGASAEFAATIHTDKRGHFEARIDKMISATSPTPQIRIQLHLPQLALLSEEERNDLAGLTTSGIHYTLSMDVASSIKILVRVLEEIDGQRLPRSKSDGILIKALISQKYKVVDAMQISNAISLKDLDFALYYEDYPSLANTLGSQADYAVIGLVSSETSSEGTLNYARGSAKLNVVDLSSGRIIATGNKSNIKAAGNTVKKANSSALKKSSYAAITEVLLGLNAALK